MLAHLPRGGSHSSRPRIAPQLEQPTRAVDAKRTCCFQRAAPIRPCSGWGLPCGPRCRSPGALLPHPFTLAWTCKQAIGGLLSVALSLGRHPRTATGRALPATLVSWSPDFPRTLRHAAAQPPGACRDRSGAAHCQADNREGRFSLSETDCLIRNRFICSNWNCVLLDSSRAPPSLVVKEIELGHATTPDAAAGRAR